MKLNLVKEITHILKILKKLKRYYKKYPIYIKNRSTCSRKKNVNSPTSISNI